MLHCQNCGISLPTGSMQCPACRAFNFQPSNSSNNQSSYNPPLRAGREPTKEANPSSLQGQAPTMEPNETPMDGRAALGEYSPSWKNRAPIKEPVSPPWSGSTPGMPTPLSPSGWEPAKEANPPSWSGSNPGTPNPLSPSSWGPIQEANLSPLSGSAPGTPNPLSPSNWGPIQEAATPPFQGPSSMDGRMGPGEYSPSWKNQAPPGRYNTPVWGSLMQAEGEVPFHDPAASPVSFSPALNAQNQPGGVQFSPSSYAPDASNAMPPGLLSPPSSLPSSSPQVISKRMFLTLVTLAGLVILSGIGLIFYTGLIRPAQMQASASATAQVLAQSTATANVYATGTGYVTATAQVKATSQAKVTATAIQNVYASATNSMPTFSSSLAAQDSGNWDVYTAAGGGGCAFTNGALHSIILKKRYYVPCFAKATDFSNFAFEAQVTIVKGDEGGLIFRADDAASKFYYFRIGRDGFYGLNVSKDDKNSTPLIYDTSSAIKTAVGQMNLLTVIANSKNIYLYINQQFVATTSDASYSDGEIGVFAGNNGNDTDVAFNNVHIWNL